MLLPARALLSRGGRGRRETGPVIFLNAGSNTTAGPGMLMSNGPPPPNPQGNGPSTANATANGTPPGNRAPKGAMPSQRLGLRATPLPPDANMAPKALKGPCQQLRRSPDLLVIMPQSFQLPEPKLGLPAPKLELPGSKLELPACSSPLPPARSSFLMLEMVADVCSSCWSPLPELPGRLPEDSGRLPVSFDRLAGCRARLAACRCGESG